MLLLPILPFAPPFREHQTNMSNFAVLVGSRPHAARIQVICTALQLIGTFYSTI